MKNDGQDISTPQQEKWYSLANIKRSPSNEIIADAKAAPESPWFSGHFPGEPIFPGVAQLGMVFDAIKQACGKNLKISQVKRVKFKQIIRPNDKIQIVAKPKDEDNNSFSFKIMVDSELACSGIMITKRS